VARSRSLPAAFLAAVGLLLTGCGALFPADVDRRERLAMLPRSGLPLDAPVTVRWNQYQIPWIEAATDADLFFTLGLVHAHLRGAQIALLRRISAGRLSEMVGPLAWDIDHALRILDYGRASETVWLRMPAESQRLLQAFTDGLNAYFERQTKRPPEFALLGIEPEPYRPQDLLRIGRLAGTDINWLGYFSLLAERGTPEFAERWHRILRAGANTAPSFTPDPALSTLADLLAASGKSGSNSVAVAASRSASGAPLLANDPHLGLTLPNLWLIAGMRSPGFHAVGLMVPGLPFVAVGSNPWLAWGGTNMRAASSDLYDVSSLDPATFETRSERIGTRFWLDTTRQVRVSPFGPVISDASVIPGDQSRPVALRWVGHEPTDEITALVAAARARDAEGFMAAFTGFGVSAQNMLFATRDGHIGQLMAVTQPVRSRFPADDPVLDATDPGTAWAGFIDARGLPAVLAPPEGFLASANNRPTGETPVPIGYFFSPGDRVQRLQAFVSGRSRLGVADLQSLQRDTLSPAAGRVAAVLAGRMRDLPAPPPRLLAALTGWDGDYAADSQGPVAFELLLYHLVPAFAGVESADELPYATGSWNYLSGPFIDDFEALPRQAADRLLSQAATKAERELGSFPTWGDMHRLRVAHALGAVPVLGRFFVLEDFPVGGSRETPMKTAHGLVNTRHHATYGQQSRHVSDLSDLDANWFLLFGGQDGWLGSANFADQIPLWRDGRMIRMPLRSETVARDFPDAVVLDPEATDGTPQ